MDSVHSQPLFNGLKIGVSPLLRFIPQPKTSSAFNFQSLLSGVANIASSSLGISSGSLSLEYQDLLQQQLETQRQMFLMSLYSNLEKSKHETQMAAVRNIRVG